MAEFSSEQLHQNFVDKRNKYFTVNVIAKRARAIVDGERPAVDAETDLNPSEIALRELEASKLKAASKTVRTKLVDIVREASERS